MFFQRMSTANYFLPSTWMTALIAREEVQSTTKRQFPAAGVSSRRRNEEPRARRGEAPRRRARPGHDYQRSRPHFREGSSGRAGIQGSAERASRYEYERAQYANSETSHIPWSKIERSTKDVWLCPSSVASLFGRCCCRFVPRGGL